GALDLVLPLLGALVEVRADDLVDLALALDQLALLGRAAEQARDGAVADRALQQLDARRVARAERARLVARRRLGHGLQLAGGGHLATLARSRSHVTRRGADGP